MLLETIDTRKNDVLIFSENRFDFKNNFKIVFKKNPSRKPEPLGFDELSAFINSPGPKNLILYRLLTNQQIFNANEAKYGIYVVIGGNYELVYPDPIFAIKEIESFKTHIDFDTFRFKIQQVGLSSQSLISGINDYSEIYFFDMRADEARYQNDRVFAEAIFAFDNSFSGEEEQTGKHMKNEPVTKTIKPAMEKIPVNAKEVNFSVDLRADNSNLQKLRTPQKPNLEMADDSQKRVRLTQQDNGSYQTKTKTMSAINSGQIKKQAPAQNQEPYINKFTKTQKEHSDKQQNRMPDDRGESLDNLFKSASTLSDFLKKRSKENVIFRLDR